MLPRAGLRTRAGDIADLVYKLGDPPSHPPPNPPPSKKCYPVLGDRGLRTKKSIGGSSYWAK